MGDKQPIETVVYECGCFQAPTGAPDICPAHHQPRLTGRRRREALMEDKGPTLFDETENDKG